VLAANPGEILGEDVINERRNLAEFPLFLQAVNQSVIFARNHLHPLSG
jgi:hypothetical protein